MAPVAPVLHTVGSSRLETLPREILNFVFQRLGETDLQNVRLTSRAVCETATRLLFSHLRVTPFRDIALILRRCKIPAFRTYISKVTFTTDDHPLWGSMIVHDIQFPRKNLSSEYEDCLRLISSLPHLCEVEVQFSPRCKAPWKLDLQDHVDEDHAFRSHVLWVLFKALGAREFKLDKMSLTLTNLQSYHYKSFTDSNIFKHVLSRISGLSINVATEYVPSMGSVAWGEPEFYHFFQELPRSWLKPGQSNLTTLALSCDELFGFVPKLDLRSIHFPRLKRLKFGNLSLSHMWQVEWILSHAETLISLVLEDCAVVFLRETFDPEDIEGYPQHQHNPKVLPGKFGPSEIDEWKEVFRLLETGLPNLVQFQFKASQFGARSKRQRDRWETLDTLTRHNLYLMYNQTEGYSPWEPVKDICKNFEIGSDRSELWVQQVESKEEDDNAALIKLSKVVRRRKRIIMSTNPDIQEELAPSPKMSRMVLWHTQSS